MQLKININMDNAAFDPDFVPELSRIFSDISERLEYLGNNKPLVIRDINGNLVGECKITN
jgi:hypothetical protein